jgi:hypothetical protein
MTCEDRRRCSESHRSRSGDRRFQLFQSRRRAQAGWIIAALLGISPPPRCVVAQALKLELLKERPIEALRSFRASDAVRHLLVDGDQRTWVLQASRALAFGRTGNLLRTGAESLNIVAPARILAMGDGRIGIHDLAGRLVVLFMDHNLEPVVMNPRQHTFDVCVSGDTLIFAGLDNGRLLHAYTIGGSYLRSFATFRQDASGLVGRAISVGVLACSQRIYLLGRRLFGDIKAFTTNGDPLWTAHLPGFRRPGISAVNGGIRIAEAPGQSHTLVTLLWVAEDVLLAQASTFRAAATDAKRVTWLVSTSGDAVTSDSLLPPVLFAVDGLLYALDESKGRVVAFEYRVHRRGHRSN